MKNKKIIITLAVVLLTVNFLLRPFLHKKESTKIVEKILSLWEAGTVADTFDYWQNIKKTPPVSSLYSYKIINNVFDKKDGRYHAKIIVEIDFDSNILTSGEWIFELSYTKLGWKVIKFYQILGQTPFTQG
ncbi:hypothetical protein KAH94_01865 [bacterium]|nr:hypothetical protein [bacterium]